MTRATHSIRLRGGGELRATRVDLLPGWLAADVVRYRMDVDDVEQVGYRVVDRVERRMIPAGRIADVRELERTT